MFSDKNLMKLAIDSYPSKGAITVCELVYLPQSPDKSKRSRKASTDIIETAKPKNNHIEPPSFSLEAFKEL